MLSDRRIVTVFGTAAPPPGSPVYEDSRALGRMLAEAGFAVATGGYSGVMEGVSHGAAEAGGHVIGVTCDRIEQLRGARVNRWVREEVHYEQVRDRVQHLIMAADALISMPGGVGTLGEVSAAWNWMQTHEIPAKPFALVGEGWRRTFETFKAVMDGFIQPPDIALLAFVADPAGAVAFVRERLGRAPVRPSEPGIMGGNLPTEAG